MGLREDDGKAEDDGNDQGGALSFQLSCLVDVVVDAFSTGSDDVVFDVFNFLFIKMKI